MDNFACAGSDEKHCEECDNFTKSTQQAMCI